MKTWGECKPGCVEEDNKLVQNYNDYFYGDDDKSGKFPDYDVVWS